MKKILLILMFAMIAQISSGQVQPPTPKPPQRVFDPKNAKLNKGIIDMIKASHVKDIAKATEIANSTKATLDFIDKANKYRKNISKFIKNTEKVGVILESQVEVLRIYAKYGVSMNFSDIMDHTTKSERETIKKLYEKIKNDSNKDIDLLKAVLTPGEMQMEDYERLEIINKIEDRLIARLYTIKRLTRKIQGAIQLNKKNKEFLSFNKKMF